MCAPTTSQVRLAWTLHRGPHVLAIPGTGSVTHLTENIAAGALRLTGDELASIDRCDGDGAATSESPHTPVAGEDG